MVNYCLIYGWIIADQPNGEAIYGIECINKYYLINWIIYLIELNFLYRII